MLQVIDVKTIDSDHLNAGEEYNRGLSLMEDRARLGEAEQAFRNAVAAGSGSDAYLQLAIVLRERGKWKEACAVFKDLVKAEPELKEAQAHLAKTFFRQERYDQAIDAFECALAIDPYYVYALVHLGITYAKLGQWVKARELLNKTEQTDCEGELRGERKQAVTEVNEYLEHVTVMGVDPTLDHAEMGKRLYILANKTTLEGNLDKAIECYELAARCRVDYSDPELGVGDTVSTHQSRMPQQTYKSCKWLEGGLHFHENRLTFCCTAHSGGKGWTAIGQFNGGSLPIDFVLAKRAQIAHQLLGDTPNNCQGCPKLEDTEPREREYLFDDLIFNNFSVCNFRCTYCSLTHRNFEMPSYYFPVKEAVNDLVDNGWLSKTGTATWGGGDPSVSKEFRPIMNRLLDHGTLNSVNTNAAIHVPEIDKGLAKNKCHLVISVDAGTRPTFYAIKFGKDKSNDEPIIIKGKEVFSSVWETIGKHTQVNADQVIVKYIVDDVNSSKEEIDEFIKKCVQFGVTRVMYTPEATFIRAIPVEQNNLPKHVYETMKYGTEQLIENGIKGVFDPFVYREAVFSPVNA